MDINNKRKGVFLNKIQACKLAKNEWIALIDSDNFADYNYFAEADNYLQNNIDNSKKNVVLAPSYAKPHFDFRHFSDNCLKKGNLKKKSIELMNAMNYILNKYLIENLVLKNEDLLLLENTPNLASDSVLLNTIFFEQLNLEMYIVPHMYYNHVVHSGSNYLKEQKNNKELNDTVYARFNKLIKN